MERYTVFNPHTFGQLSYKKGGKNSGEMNSGEKAVYSISGAGKTGLLHIKEQN